jgi:putative ABC transport system ATP-binding protein
LSSLSIVSFGTDSTSCSEPNKSCKLIVDCPITFHYNKKRNVMFGNEFHVPNLRPKLEGRVPRMHSHQLNKNGVKPSDVQQGLTALINLRAVTKRYESGAGTFTALNAVDLQVQASEFIAVVGKSGSGKSTLLNILSGIDSPTSGEVIIGETAIHNLNQNQIAVWRGRQIGVVFQFFQLLPTLTVIENIILPMDFCNSYPARERKQRALLLLEQVGIADQAYKLPALLSGGQQQRAAIARAQANNPPILLADEPTGNLDSHTAEAMLQLFQNLTKTGKTVVMVTHERDIAPWVSRIVTLADGQIVTNTQTPGQAISLPLEVAHV